jgi:hypothetical protein
MRACCLREADDGNQAAATRPVHDGVYDAGASDLADHRLRWTRDVP